MIIGYQGNSLGNSSTSGGPQMIDAYDYLDN